MRHPPLRWNRLTSHIQPSVLRMSGRGLRPAWTRVVKAKVRQKAETDSQNKQRRPAYPHVPSGRNRAQAQGFPHQEGVGGQSGLAKKGRAKAVDQGFDDAGADQTPDRHPLQTKQGHAYRSLTTSDRYGAIGGDRGEDQGGDEFQQYLPARADLDITGGNPLRRRNLPNLPGHPHNGTDDAGGDDDGGHQYRRRSHPETGRTLG